MSLVKVGLFKTSIITQGVLAKVNVNNEEVAAYLSGTQLFLVDSLTAGPGNIKPVPYYLAKIAHTEGRLRNLWIKPIGATTQATQTGMASTDTTFASAYSTYGPNCIAYENDGGSAGVLTLSFSEFPWQKVRMYYALSSTGGTFEITQPTSQVVDMTGVDGQFGYVDIINPASSDLTSLKISTLDKLVIFGFLQTVDSEAANPLDIINFAISGCAIDEYNACVNIVDWYNELGITGAIINAGANNSSDGYTASLSFYRTMMDDLAAAGIAGTDILTMRPNGVTKILGDMWEDIAEEYGTRFTSIVRIYGDLAVFNANDWMASGDNVHPNDGFNEMQAVEEYNLNLVDLHDVIELGKEPNWLTALYPNTYGALESELTISGDFSCEVRWYWSPTYNRFWGSASGSDSFRINIDGTMQIRIDGDVEKSTQALTESGWYTFNISRTGDNIIVEVNGIEFINATSYTTADLTISYLFRDSNGLSNGAIPAWITFDGLHQWIFNQHDENDSVPDLIGSANVTWGARTTSTENPIKYSIMPDGTLLDYHYNLPTDMVWGDVSWPTV